MQSQESFLPLHSQIERKGKQPGRGCKPVFKYQKVKQRLKFQGTSQGGIFVNKRLQQGKMQKKEKKINFSSLLQKEKLFLPLQPQTERKVLQAKLKIKSAAKQATFRKVSKKVLAVRKRMPNFGSPNEGKTKSAAGGF